MRVILYRHPAFWPTEAPSVFVMVVRSSNEDRKTEREVPHVSNRNPMPESDMDSGLFCGFSEIVFEREANLNEFPTRIGVSA